MSNVRLLHRLLPTFFLLPCSLLALLLSKRGAKTGPSKEKNRTNKEKHYTYYLLFLLHTQLSSFLILLFYTHIYTHSFTNSHIHHPLLPSLLILPAFLLALLLSLSLLYTMYSACLFSHIPPPLPPPPSSSSSHTHILCTLPSVFFSFAHGKSTLYHIYIHPFIDRYV